MGEKPILLTTFLRFDEPAAARVKFNMHTGEPFQLAWDLLRDDDPRWVEMNSWRKKKTSNEGVIGTGVLTQVSLGRRF